MKNNLIGSETKLNITVQDNVGSRLDKYLTSRLEIYSRSFIQELIDAGHIKVNNKIITKPKTEIKPGDEIEIFFPKIILPDKTDIDKNLEIKIIYEHAQFLIIYKPANLVVHAPNKSSQIITLTDWLINKFKELTTVGPSDRPGIVHRLDKETSGLMIIARNNISHNIFTNLFKDRQISKNYLAIVKGHPAQSGSIDFKITRDLINRHKMKAVKNLENTGREALTNYKVLEYLQDASLVQANPITGRTHQIRVHMAAIGHGIIGDKTYGVNSKLINRQALHAYKLSFYFDNIYYAFISDIPEDMKFVIKNLKKTNNLT